jgi:hypothetical protein
MAFIQCTTTIEPGALGDTIAYTDAKGHLIARKLTWIKDYSAVFDLRGRPPYLAISPCPYCGTENDRGHNPLLHVDTRLGVKV